MYFKVEGGDDSEKDLDDLELHLVVSLGHTVADGFNDCIDEFAGQAPIHIG